MKVEQLDRGRAIAFRLHELKKARRLWEEEDQLGCLFAFFGAQSSMERSANLPLPIVRFKRECLDVIATEEAALQAEFDAL